MKFEVTKYNHEKVDEIFRVTKAINFVIGNVHCSGVNNITAEKHHIFDGDPIPGECDGGGEDRIDIKFNFAGGGYATISFCPDREHCEVSQEMDDLWFFNVESILDYINRENENLDYIKNEYEKYMKDK